MSLKYRPEIDGLRALAVISVIFYHAELILLGDVNPFRGGFIGVDIFFVISGYLITLIILKEISKNSFSFANFYERRARRILPALLIVITTSVPFAWFYMLPKALKEYSGSVLSSLFFGSNIWFFQQDGYTTEASALKPFLHTWSLSIEEQFYMIFPIVLILLWKFCRAYLTGILVLGLLASLQLAHFISADYQNAAFYLLPTRGWELLAGAILAKLELTKGRISRPLLDIAAPLLGLLLICYSIAFYGDHIKHPSWVTVPPIVGTMLLIWFCKKGEFITDILSSRPFVAVGLISYSLYLWHFPILAFARINEIGTTDYAQWWHILLAVVLAYITYRFIEQPARNNKLISSKIFLSVILITTTILVATLTYIYKTDGAKFRLNEYELLFETGELNLPIESKHCFRPTPILGKHCKFITANAIGTIIGIGDSHLDVFSRSLYNLAKKHNMNYIQFPDCAWILNTDELREDGERRRNRCPEAQLKELSALEPAIVVNSQRITYRLVDFIQGGVFKGKKTYQPLPINDKVQTIEQAVTHSNKEILALGHTLVQIFPIPENNFHVPKKYKQLLNGTNPLDYKNTIKNADIGTSYFSYRKRHKKIFQALESIEDPKYIKIYPSELFCSEKTNKCKTDLNSNLLYMDTDHLSKYAADLVIAELEKKLFD
jgi:peptidoglycan/LPS O-acetylase OafA/YrhL